MALRAPVAQQAEENGLAAAPGNVKAAAGKAAPSLLNQCSKRRNPLGDVSNLQPQRNALGKDGKAAPVEISKPVTRSSARLQARQSDAGPAPAPGPVAAVPRAAAPASFAAPAQQLGAAPRATRAPAPAAGPARPGVSLSSLLQSRSEAAVTTRKAGAPPSSPLPDIDREDRYNPLMAAQYVNDIYSYYKRVEPMYRVAEDYITKQADINEKMRAILIDWLVEVHLKFKLMPETLFLTVNLIDRFLAEKQVTRKNLQLVGVTAMLIASKYEEIWAPEVRDFVYISDRAYTKEQILGMEKLMLNTLKFQLTLPTIYNFLARNLKAANMHFDKDVTMLASYLVELALVEYSMQKFSYSMISVSALYVAMRAYERPNCFPHALAKHSGYSLEQIQPSVISIVEQMNKAPTSTLTAVYKKYSVAKFNEASKQAAPMYLVAEANEIIAQQQ